MYVTPAHQYPLGARMSAARRTALIGWARERGALVVEDDYDGELRHDGPAPAGQRVLVEFARSGALSRHLRRVRREMLARRDLLADTLRGAGLRVLGDRAGAHLVVDLPSADAVDLTERCHLGTPARHGVAVGYAAPDSRGEIEHHIPALLAALTATCGGSGQRGP